MLYIFVAVIIAVAIGVYFAVNAAGVKLTREHLKAQPDDRPDDLKQRDEIDDAIDIEY